MKLLLENWKSFLNEACWKGYTQKGMKKKGDRMVPNCVPIQEEEMKQDMDSLENWEHEDAKGYAKKLIEEYGEPDILAEGMALWNGGISEFDKVYVKDESIEHCCPKPHRDYVYSTMTIDVPEELMEAVAQASESIIVDQLKNEVTARCADIFANAITLGFVQKLVEGEIDPKDAKKEYERHIIDGIIPEWFKEEQSLSEKKKKKKKKKKKGDRCTRIAKRKYDVWPSAYASGAVVKCRQGKIWKDLKEEELSDDDQEELEAIEKELEGASKTHKSQAERIGKITKEGACPGKATLKIKIKNGSLNEKKKKAGTESRKESSLKDWFGRKGAKGKKGGWVDCNAPDGKGGYKACGREEGEKRSKYPACRPTPGACKEKGKGKSWGKKGAKKKK